MNHKQRTVGAVAAALFSCAMLAGCQNDSSASMSTTGSTAAAPETGMAGAGPMNDKERMRQQEWLDATQHLIMDRADGTLGVRALTIGDADPAQFESFMNDAQSLMESNRWVPAVGAYAEAARHAPSSAEPWIGMAIAFHPQAKYDLMDRALASALDRDATRVDARMMRADLHWTRGEQGEAIDAAQAVLLTHPSSVDAHGRLARWYFYTGAYESAWEHVHATESLGGSVPGQLRRLLSDRMPEPS